MKNKLEPQKLAQAALFGVCFGFLLQKGGVAKYNVLIGQLMLHDFTVAKVMLTAILVGMIGIYFLHVNAGVELHIKPTRIGSNVIGGLVFGIGFAMAGYCPGTGAAALGQGDLHAVWFMLGLVAGSYLFAEMSSLVRRTIDRWGDEGKLRLPSLIGLSEGKAVSLMAILIAGALLFLEKRGH